MPHCLGQLDSALYLPALNSAYTEYVGDPRNRAVPILGEFTVDDLNFLNPASKLFHWPVVLFSVGQLEQNERLNFEDGMIAGRDRENTILYGDSGGYQIATGVLQRLSQNDVMQTYDWLDTHCDVAMTLDVPTPVGPIIRMFFGSTSSRRSSGSCLRRQRFLSATATARLAAFWPTM